ncbi:PREDICTED: uncharacterized protein LOC106742997 [Dinoponera quadriceps]|uniref:Uncharacterized protein LOC106742997 n=1 Tax=Dinoponera quadriceps TaxID=609295 RepID=A0A6P3X0K7_DINQU|nr:PREDICTED: uncharacterized protein LOC106742997 [Dinoponera quadriceps]
MSINTLYAAFRKLAVDRIGAAAATATARYYSTQQINLDVSRFMHNVPSSAVPVHDIKFKPGTLSIDFGIPTRRSVPSIIEMPVARIPPLREPTKSLPLEYDSPLPQTSVDLPTIGGNFEKQAVRMIVIRRKKMKKHKRRKLRKKMKFVWARMRQRRNVEKIKRFNNEMIAKIKMAQAFDAKKYVQGRLDILNKERIPRTFRGEILPLEMIKKLRDEKQAKKDARLNKPILKL